MSTLPSITRRLSAAAAVCLGLIVAAPAQAGVIASFDPAFGASIPNLGFRGTINLDVSAGCYTLGSGFQFTGGSCTITATSAQINFYNFGAGTPNTTITTVNLGPGFFAADYVFGAYFDPLTGQLAGLDTNDSDQFGVSVTDPNPLFPINYIGDMLLYFASGTQPIEIDRASFAAVAPAATVPGVGGAFLVNCNPANQQEEGFCQSGDPSTTSNPGLLTFTTVPEPDSIALALLGFGALAFTRRRARIARKA